MAEDIRCYCKAHPGASDSLEGIAWWVAFQRVEKSCADLIHAVDHLVAVGDLRRHQLPDGRFVFGCSCAPSPSPAPLSQE